MARDYFSLGSAPFAEECVSLSPDEDYLPAMRQECNRFIGVMRKIMGEEPPGAKLAIMSNPHDFGTYLDVVCYFDDQNEAAVDYAARCELEVPEYWPTEEAPPEEQVKPKPDRVCDSCSMLAYGQGLEDDASQQLLMMELGADVEDHICDAVDDQSITCACGCRSR